MQIEILLNCLTRFTYLEDLEDVCQHSRPVLVVGGEDDPGVAAGVDAGGDVGAAAEGGLGEGSIVLMRKKQDISKCDKEIVHLCAFQST